MLRLTFRIEAFLLALALALPSPAAANPAASRQTLRDLSVQESPPKRAGLEEALQPSAASGLEELQLGEEQDWAGTQGGAIGRIRSIVRAPEAAGGEPEVVGRVVYPDPARVRIISHWDPRILEEDFPQWQDPPASLDLEQKKRLDDSGRSPDQWRQELEGPDREPLVLLTDSLQPDFHQPYGFLIVGGKVIRQRYAWRKYPLTATILRKKEGYDDAFFTFVLEPGPPRVTALRFRGRKPVEELTRMSLQDGRPIGAGAVRDPAVTHAISGIPLLLNGQDVSTQVRSNRVPQAREIRPNEVTWPTDRKAAFSVIGTDRGGPPILLSVTAHAGLPELVDLMRRAGMTDGVLRQGSGGVLQWLAGENYPPLHGVADMRSERSGEQGVRPANAVLAGYEIPAAGLEEGQVMAGPATSERISAAEFQRKFPGVDLPRGAQQVALVPADAQMNVQIYADPSLLSGLEELASRERGDLPADVRVSIRAVPGSAAFLEKPPGAVFWHWLTGRLYEQEVLPEAELNNAQPMPRLAAIFLFALQGPGAEIEAVIGLMKLEDAQGRAVYAYFV